MPDITRPEIFVSYSHHDAAWRERLFGDSLDTPFGDCQIWTDARIRAGERWRDQIDQRLANSTVAVLLVSKHFLQSEFIAQRELPAILAQAAAARLRIVWVAVGVDRKTVQAWPSLAELQAGVGFNRRLPAEPGRCSDEALQQVRALIRHQMLSAVDPVWAELAQRLAPRYTLGQRIGAGNRCTVYAAHDQVLKRNVAIKVPRDQGQRQAFMSDVRDGIRTSEEPNFINIYDAAADGENAYCVVQHVGGKTLKALIREHPQGLPVQTLRHVFQRVAGAIAGAHARGVTYGNLKPSNIMLDEKNEPFVLPVGRKRDRARDEQKVRDLLARLGQQAAAGQSASAEDLEDLAYLVPDHFDTEFENGQPQLGDQYMLGVLSYEMATGELPVTVPRPERLLTDRLAAFKPLPSITERRALCPQRLATLVARMAARQPAQRFASLQDALAETDLMDDLGLVIARDSYRRCAALPDFDARFFRGFYDRFMQRCPGAAAFFQGFDAAQWARQHRMLKEAVLLLFAFRQQSDHLTEPNVLSRIAESHGRIPQAFYQPFLDALVHTVCGDRDGDEGGNAPGFDPLCAVSANRDKLAQFWHGALAPGIDYLRRRAALVQAAELAAAGAAASTTVSRL